MAGPRTTVRNLNRTREKILAAALAEFSARGFAGARVDAIARRARVNKRMLYYCFGAKQELYREILRRKIDERAEFIWQKRQSFGRTPKRLPEELRFTVQGFTGQSILTFSKSGERWARR